MSDNAGDVRKTRLTLQNSDSSVVEPLNNYLGSLCADSTEKCSNATLTSAQQTVQSACASDLSNAGGDGAVSVLNGLFTSYPQFYTAACSKNETTNSYCVTSILQQLQNATGQNLNFGSVANLIGGGTDGLSQLNSALNDGQLCTGCVAGYVTVTRAAAWALDFAHGAGGLFWAGMVVGHRRGSAVAAAAAEACKER